MEKEIQDMGGKVATLAMDVTKEQDNNALAQLAIDHFGAINLVVPCAGIIRDGHVFVSGSRNRQNQDKMSLQQFSSVIDINLTGVFLTVRECAEQMVNHDCKGLICLISSTGSLGTAGQINYSSTKAAMSVMPKVITAEFFRRGLAHKIRCVAVAPGYVGTAMVKGMNQKALDKIIENFRLTAWLNPKKSPP